MIRRIIGAILLLTGILGVVLSIAGIVFGLGVLSALELGIQDTLSLASDNLGTTREALGLTKTVIAETSTGLDSVQQMMIDTGQAVKDASPLLKQVSQIVTQEVPGGLDSVQKSIPNLAGVADTIDGTLSTLGMLGIIDYSPAVPLGEPIAEIGTGLGDLSGSFRDLKPDLGAAQENLDAVGVDVLEASQSLGSVNDNMVGYVPLLDEYLVQIDVVVDSIEQAQAALGEQFQIARWVFIFFMLWLALAQVAPLYLGWELISGRRDPDSGQ